MGPLVRRHLACDRAVAGALPFAGGAIGYFGYDLARRIERLPSSAAGACSGSGPKTSR